MTEQIAILTPTMNRSEFVLRALQYYSSVGFRGQLVFGDASRPDERARMHEYIQRYEGRLRIACHHLEHLPFPNDAYSLKEIIDRTDAPYMVYAGDDDLLVPKTLQRCAEFLDAHPDYSAAHGKYISYQLPHAGAFGSIVETNSAPQHVLTSDSALVRWRGYMRLTLSTQYYVHRKATWRRMYEHLPRVLTRYLGPEVLPCSISVIDGKVHEIDALSVLFQVNPVRPFGWNTHSAYSLSCEDSWAPAMRGLKEVVTREIAERDHLTQSQAELEFDKEMWRHLLIISQAHYDLRGYDPVNALAVFKRRFPKIIRLSQVLRQMRTRRYRGCSLPQLSRPNHPYHDDFAAMRRCIEHDASAELATAP